MKKKTLKVALEGLGEYLRISEGCLVVMDEERRVRGKYPLSEEIEEVRLKSGNLVSVGALAALAMWKIPTLILTRHGNPVATLKRLDDDAHVETRCQYDAFENGKGVEIAKQVLLAKIKGENELLRKYGLHQIDYGYFSQAVKEVEGKDVKAGRNKLMSYEGKCASQYWKQVLQLFNESIRPEKRRTYKAYEGLNNVLNLAYIILFWKVLVALWRAKLEPHLGFLHATKSGKSSLVFDFMEIYRYLVDDFVIGYARTVHLSEADFVLVTENYAGRKEKRQYLDYNDASEFNNRLNMYFESKVSIPRITGGKRQEIETLIIEEAMLLAMYLRDEKKTWIPRVVSL